jgi:hypothetical protein
MVYLKSLSVAPTVCRLMIRLFIINLLEINRNDATTPELVWRDLRKPQEKQSGDPSCRRKFEP